jgi:hypothetical protein
MRNISLSLAALTLLLAGSLTSVAFADTEKQHVAGRADRDTVSATTVQSQTKSDLVVSDASGGIYDNADKFRDSMGHPLAGWQYVIYGTVNG